MKVKTLGNTMDERNTGAFVTTVADSVTDFKVDTFGDNRAEIKVVALVDILNDRLAVVIVERLVDKHHQVGVDSLAYLLAKGLVKINVKTLRETLAHVKSEEFV